MNNEVEIKLQNISSNEKNDFELVKKKKMIVLKYNTDRNNEQNVF